MRRVTLLLLGANFHGLASAANATPVMAPDPPMSAVRIDRLPAEIRQIVLSNCGADAAAGHYFATYEYASNVIHLDYSLLQCPDAPRGAGRFGHLRQTFVKQNGRYVLSRTEGSLSRPLEPAF